MISTQFINDCLSGNEDALKTLVRTHQRQVFQLCLSILDDSAATPAESVAHAEAATRDTFIKAIDRLGSYREDTSFTIWLFRIAIEVARKHAGRVRISRYFGRITGRRKPMPVEGGAELPHGETHLADDALWQTIRGLNQNLRIPVVLRYYHDFPISEIARLLRISEGTVHARLDAAREKLARGLD